MLKFGEFGNHRVILRGLAIMLKQQGPAAAGTTVPRVLLALCAASALFVSCTSTAIGVDFGQLSDSLPPNNVVLQLVQSLGLNKFRIYGADAGVLTTFASSGIDIIIGADNTEVQPMASTAGYAMTWAQNNIAAYPNTNIVAVAVGNEILTSDTQLTASIVPALQNLQAALVSLGLSQKVKVSTPHSLNVLGTSFPPSAGQFSDGSTMSSILGFLSQTGSPFMVNVYPFFAYESNPSSIPLDYALFSPSAAPVTDSGTGLTYHNLFDAEVDAVYAAISALGYTNVNLAITETGWPSAGDPNEIGASVANAQSYISNLVQHVNSGVGTPAKPGVTADTYIFDLYNEDLKTGATSERNFGLYNTDGTAVYDSGL